MRIQSIQCPECGSHHYNQIQEDLYQCQRCQTEYDPNAYDEIILHNYTEAETSFWQVFKKNTIRPLMFVTFLLVALTVWFLITNQKEQPNFDEAIWGKNCNQEKYERMIKEKRHEC